MAKIPAKSQRASFATVMGNIFSTPSGAELRQLLRSELVEAVMTHDESGKPVTGDALQQALGQRQLAIKLIAAGEVDARNIARRKADAASDE